MTLRCGSIYGLLEIVLLCYGTIHGQSRGFEEKLIIGFQAITSHRLKKPQAGMEIRYPSKIRELNNTLKGCTTLVELFLDRLRTF